MSGILIDTIRGTVEIPAEKLQQINVTVHQWMGKDVVTKGELQSILGLLLYVHKCVRLAKFFLNRMLEVLRNSHSTQKITLTSELKRDLRWFARFLQEYNGVTANSLTSPLSWPPALLALEVVLAFTCTICL